MGLTAVAIKAANPLAQSIDLLLGYSGYLVAALTIGGAIGLLLPGQRATESVDGTG